MTHCFSRRSFLKGSAAAAAALTSPLLPADAAFSETENGLFSPVSALCQTQYGPVKGREGENGQLCWYGIPYGAAPTGESRWTAPQEPARWFTVRDCTSPAPAAYQYTTFPLGTEDCLTLDIYSSAEAKKRPVLVYLHGSAATGSSLELPGSELVRDAGCVFVALNYRLGLFGWNCLPALTSGSDAAGNFALLDIARALDWVYGLVQLAVVLAVPVLALYNGQRGPSPRVNTVMKWLFYLYYPAHLALIGWLQMQ